MKKLKKIVCAVFAFLLVGSNIGGSIVPVLAIEGDSATVKNDPNGPTVLEDGVRLHKTARAVPGYANEWEVTLKIEAPAVTVTSDTVVIIDRSNSMSSTMLSNAKAAATSLAEELLPEGNRVNRVAVLSFGTDVRNKTNGFSDSFSVVNNAINGTSGIAANGGGTFTQGAIHAAAQLLAGSTATHKSIVLLSDGVPSYSYDIKNVSGSDLETGHTMIGTGSRQFKVMSSADKFDYSERVGDGSRYTWEPDGREMWDDYDDVWIDGRRYNAYYDHGNSAIAEANFFKATGATLHTIAYNAGTLGNSVLNSMATQGKSHTSSGDDLEDIFDDIAGEISSLVGNSHVHDVMGEGVYVDNATYAVDLDWDPVFTFNSTTNMYEASTTYRVSANEAMLEDSVHETAEGFHRLNKSASITYGDNVTGYFPVPYVKPFFVNVKKEIEGQQCAEGECMFDFKIEHPQGLKETYYSVEAGKTHRIMEPFPIGDYTLTELGETAGSNNPIAFEHYTTTYTGNQFTISENHADHIDVVIKNTYETVDLSASKVWQDDNDRDGLRKNYTNLYVVVKDGDNYVAHEKVTGATNQSFEFNGLPKNRNGSAIRYTLGEATCTSSGTTLNCRDFSDNSYASTVGTGNVITNAHTPAKTQLTIKKKWDTSAGTLPSSTPGFVTVEVSNDKNDTVKTVTLRGENYAEWTGEFEDYMYENGEEIHYSVKEKDIAGSALNGDNTLYVYKDNVLEGKWVATKNGVEITNTWTPAETVYTGVGEFNIKKVDQDNAPLAGVTFTVGNKTYTTGNEGTAKVEFSGATEKPENSYTFNITETSAPEFYDIVTGTEVLTATTNLELSVDEKSLTNTYTKSFGFAVRTAVDGYVWQNNNSTLLVTNQALADELKIEKTFEGISANAFGEKSQIKFTITGPDGFSEMTIGNGDRECTISGSKLTCIIDGDNVLIPVGEYTVTEKDADITNFTYTSEPTSKRVKVAVGVGETAEFKFKNTYNSVNTASYKVKKIWNDDDDRDGLRPDTLAITLLADGKAYGEPVELEGDDWEHEWTELPLMNEDAEEIEYTAIEENLGDDYSSDNGVMKDGVFTFTNTHEPAMHDDIVAQKVWAGEGNELVRPGSVSVELLANGDVIDRADIMAGQNNEWTYTFTNLYANEDGEPIEYSVRESMIGETAFGQGESVIVVRSNDGAITGSWTKKEEGNTVTNTWKKATDEIVYEGATKFYIKKVDEDYKPMAGVTFAAEGSVDRQTDAEGMTLKNVYISSTNKEDNLKYTISEKATLDGYDLVEGSATVSVICSSVLANADVATLVNTYTKTCEFTKSGSDKYVWDAETLTMTVVNKRSLAKSLTIEKTVKGLKAEVLADLEFTVKGPEDFGEKGVLVLKASDDCTVSDESITCKIEGRIPTGNYTVTEGNADVENFELTVSGDNDVEKKVEKDDEIVFEITNEYEVDRIMYYVDKIWEDAHDKDGERPEKLTINLLENGEIIDTIDLTMNDAYIIDEEDEDYVTGDIWGFVWEGLPYADEYAEVIVYTAEEILESDEYEQLEMYNDEYGTLFINYHELDDPCAEGGCGGDIIPPAPETGRFTGVRGGGNVTCENTLAAGLAVVMMTLIGVPILVTAVTRRKK